MLNDFRAALNEGARKAKASADFQPDARRVMLPVTAKGSGGKQVTHIPVPVADDVLVRVRSLTTGRSAHHRLLLRWHHRQVHGDQARGIAPV